MRILVPFSGPLRHLARLFPYYLMPITICSNTLKVLAVPVLPSMQSFDFLTINTNAYIADAFVPCCMAPFSGGILWESVSVQFPCNDCSLSPLTNVRLVK